MTDNYEPTKKQIAREMLRFKGTSETFEGLKDFGFMAGGIGGIVVSFPYAIPSYVRWFREGSGEDSSLTCTQTIGGVIGAIGGILIDIGQIVGYTHLIQNDYPGAWKIPVATNIVSGAYEILRHSSKKAKQRLIKEHEQGKDLESISVSE